MIGFFKKLFSKGDEDYALRLPQDAKAHFVLMLDDIEIGYLNCHDGFWEFEYSSSFKSSSNLKPIVGFPDINKKYSNDTLWPFFRLRIPGLKQPRIQEILESEKIDKENEVALLKRFGKWTIANPYELVAD